MIAVAQVTHAPMRLEVYMEQTWQHDAPREKGQDRIGRLARLWTRNEAGLDWFGPVACHTLGTRQQTFIFLGNQS